MKKCLVEILQIMSKRGSYKLINLEKFLEIEIFIKCVIISV